MSLRKNDRDMRESDQQSARTDLAENQQHSKGVSVNTIFFVSRGVIDPSNTSVLILSPTLYFEKRNSFFQTATVMREIPGDLAGFQRGAHLIDGACKRVTQVVL